MPAFKLTSDPLLAFKLTSIQITASCPLTLQYFGSSLAPYVTDESSSLVDSINFDIIAPLLTVTSTAFIITNFSLLATHSLQVTTHHIMHPPSTNHYKVSSESNLVLFITFMDFQVTYYNFKIKNKIINF